jgi:RNA polymerase sigma-70 factor (ECF subfamily)
LRGKEGFFDANFPETWTRAYAYPRMDNSPSEDFVRNFAAHRDRLYAYIRTLLPRRADAEDVFQRCSVVLWRKFDGRERNAPFLSWACGVAFYEVRNFLRVSSRDRLRFGDALLETLARERAAAMDRRDARAAALEQCLETLEAGERELLRRTYEEEETVADLARRSGEAARSLYGRLSGIRRRLLDCATLRMASAEGAR